MEIVEDITGDLGKYKGINLDLLHGALLGPLVLWNVYFLFSKKKLNEK